MMDLVAMRNPWWSGERDPTLTRWGSAKVKWIPRWVEEIGLEPFSLNFVIGPRQIGKTTGLKLLIKNLLKVRDPESIFYFNCDFLADMASLKNIIDLYLRFKKSEGLKNSFIFLDEITSVPEWWRIVKGYIDLGVFERDVITITGSSSLKLRGETELFPGRRGGGRNVFVHPLSFREFLDINGIKIKRTGDLARDMTLLMKKERVVKELFHTYVKTGGFPLSINRDPEAGEQFMAGFEGEVLRSNHSLQLVKEIIASIMKKSPSPLSFSTIGRDVGVSYKTVQEYVELLKNIFVLGTALYKSERIRWRKERKFFFLDPFLVNTLSLWSGEGFLESAFYEWIVQAHLLRRFGSVFYFRNSFEIDCIADGLRIEVKVGKPHRNYPKGVLVIGSEDLPKFLAVVV